MDAVPGAKLVLRVVRAGVVVGAVAGQGVLRVEVGKRNRYRLRRPLQLARKFEPALGRGSVARERVGVQGVLVLKWRLSLIRSPRGTRYLSPLQRAPHSEPPSFMPKTPLRLGKTIFKLVSTRKTRLPPRKCHLGSSSVLIAVWLILASPLGGYMNLSVRPSVRVKGCR